jgi:hypothetical protein
LGIFADNVVGGQTTPDAKPLLQLRIPADFPMSHRLSYSTKISDMFVRRIKCRFSGNVRRSTDEITRLSLHLAVATKGRQGMTQTDSDRIMELCRLICEEHNPSRFQKLVTELNQLLVKKEQTLTNPPGSINPAL